MARDQRSELNIMTVRKLGHLPVNQQVYLHLLDLIMTKGLAPGARLDEQSLAKEMGVSRTPLREAIGRLVEKGLVEHRPYQGNFVRTFTTNEVNDIYQVRRALEELAIRLTTANLTDEKLAEIREILNDIDDAMKRSDVDAINEADARFHTTIAEFSGNQALISSLHDLDNQVQIIRSMANQNPDVVIGTAIQRSQVLSALESRNADLAAQLLGEHIDFVRQSVIAGMSAGATEAPAD